MNNSSIVAEHTFRDGPSIVNRWSAARELMASRKFIPYVESEDFRLGWTILLKGAATTEGLDRLLHIDLIVRISSFVKRLKLETATALRAALEIPLPSLNSVAASNELPRDAKAAEIRENVATSLQYANDTWVYNYIIESLANEDRSQRCRTKLVECLASRTPYLNSWMDDLAGQESLRRLQRESSSNAAAKRLGDIAIALAHVVRQNRARLDVTDSTGLKVAKFSNMMVYITREDKMPKHLCFASLKTVGLLDEILNVDLSLIVEPKTYSFLDVIRSWWQVVPYPRVLFEALEPIVLKLKTAIIIRARFGQKSDALVGHLATALGGRRETRKFLHSVADTHTELLPEIDDWLRGRERIRGTIDDAVTKTMQGVATQAILTQVAPIVLLASESESRVIGNNDERYGKLQSIVNHMAAFASNNNIELFGDVGVLVEFSSELHSTADGRIPTEARVPILRSGVRRRRVDGGFDILLKASVK